MDDVAPQKKIGTAKFYGNSVPRPTAILEGKKVKKDREFAPDGPNAPLLDWAQKVSFHNGGGAPDRWVGKVPEPARTAFCLLVAQKQRNLVAEEAESKPTKNGLKALKEKRMRPKAIQAAVEEWPLLSKPAKAKFEKAAKEDLERFEAEMKEFVHANPDYEAWTGMEAEQFAKSKPAEKAFRHFVLSEWKTLLEDRPELAALSTDEGCALVQEEARVSWKELSTEDRKPFNDLAAADAARFQEAHPEAKGKEKKKAKAARKKKVKQVAEEGNEEEAEAGDSSDEEGSEVEQGSEDEAEEAASDEDSEEEEAAPVKPAPKARGRKARGAKAAPVDEEAEEEEEAAAPAKPAPKAKGRKARGGKAQVKAEEEKEEEEAEAAPAKPAPKPKGRKARGAKAAAPGPTLEPEAAAAPADVESKDEAPEQQAGGPSMIGRKISKAFGEDVFHGVVEFINPAPPNSVKLNGEPAEDWYHILYEDGDGEDLTLEELTPCLLPIAPGTEYDGPFELPASPAKAKAKGRAKKASATKPVGVVKAAAKPRGAKKAVPAVAPATIADDDDAQAAAEDAEPVPVAKKAGTVKRRGPKTAPTAVEANAAEDGAQPAAVKKAGAAKRRAPEKPSAAAEADAGEDDAPSAADDAEEPVAKSKRKAGPKPAKQGADACSAPADAPSEAAPAKAPRGRSAGAKKASAAVAAAAEASPKGKSPKAATAAAADAEETAAAAAPAGKPRKAVKAAAADAGGAAEGSGKGVKRQKKGAAAAVEAEGVGETDAGAAEAPAAVPAVKSRKRLAKMAEAAPEPKKRALKSKNENVAVN